jgi:hypothetical protein
LGTVRGNNATAWVVSFIHMFLFNRVYSVWFFIGLVVYF